MNNIQSNSNLPGKSSSLRLTHPVQHRSQSNLRQNAKIVDVQQSSRFVSKMQVVDRKDNFPKDGLQNFSKSSATQIVTYQKNNPAQLSEQRSQSDSSRLQSKGQPRVPSSGQKNRHYSPQITVPSAKPIATNILPQQAPMGYKSFLENVQLIQSNTVSVKQLPTKKTLQNQPVQQEALLSQQKLPSPVRLDSMQQQYSNQMPRRIVVKREHRQFLNVDANTNKALLTMIDVQNPEWNFEGFSKFVINASELLNKQLHEVLYSVPNIIPEKIMSEARLKNRRSRNAAQQLYSGQSVQTLEFFKTKIAINGSEEPAFYSSLKNEIQHHGNETILGLMPSFQPAKFSTKRNGCVAAYGANTNEGISRNYNEDRVAIILNIMCPKNKRMTDQWPKCSFFGVYDGHGGHACADFLRDYLHQLIIKDDHFPKDPAQAIRNGFAEAEKLFLEYAEGQETLKGELDKSGSCAIITLIIDDICFIANTGDSRAVMSANGGKQVITLSNDHKPTDEIEVERILRNNGRIYQNTTIISQTQGHQQVVCGPHRVFPGRLSVCRTFGDIEAKLPRLCGNPNVVIVDPDISSFKIEKDKHDFVALGCDGIFDKLEDKDLVHTVWQSVINKSNTNNSNGNYDHRLSGQAVDAVLKTSALRRSADNITVVFVAFDNFYKLVEEAKGDLTKFEPGQIELQSVEVIQPPEKMTSGQHTKKSLDILIEEDMPSAVDVTPKEEFVVGDTGDSSFQKPLNEDVLQLSEIAEEETIDVKSATNLGFKVPQKQKNSESSLKGVSNYFTDNQRLQPAASPFLVTKQMISKSLPKHESAKALQQQTEQINSIYQKMKMRRSSNQPESTVTMTRGGVNQTSGQRLFTEDNVVPYSQINKMFPSTIQILKPPSARRRKVVQPQKQTISNGTSQILSNYLTQIKQSQDNSQKQPQVMLVQPNSNIKSRNQLITQKSRNGQLNPNLVPKQWNTATNNLQQQMNNLTFTSAGSNQNIPHLYTNHK